MPVFSMPVIINIEADTLAEAQKSLEEWNDSVDMDDDLPVGTEDIDIEPATELNEEGQRILILPVNEDLDEEDQGLEDATDDDFCSPDE